METEKMENKNEEGSYLPHLKKLSKTEKDMLKEPVFLGEMVSIFENYNKDKKGEEMELAIAKEEYLTEAIVEAWIDVDEMYQQDTLPETKDLSEEMYQICKSILTFYAQHRVM